MTVLPHRRDRGPARRRAVLAGGFLLILLMAIHLALNPDHVAAELGALAAVAAAAFGIGWVLLRAERSSSRARLEEATRAARREAVSAALEDLSSVVDRHFDAWQLTPAEREITLLLLQGETHKNVARRTGRSERTVRQHAVDVYRKSGLGGRAELAGHFLDALILSAPASSLEGDAPPG